MKLKIYTVITVNPMIKTILLLIALSISASAQTAYTFAVIRASVTQVISESTLKNYGYKVADLAIVAGQPFRLTTYKISPTGKYLMITITPKGTQWDTINKLVDRGCAQLISSIDIISIRNQRHNCYEQTAQYIQYRELPDDYTVKASSK